MKLSKESIEDLKFIFLMLLTIFVSLISIYSNLKFTPIIQKVVKEVEDIYFYSKIDENIQHQYNLDYFVINSQNDLYAYLYMETEGIYEDYSHFEIVYNYEKNYYEVCFFKNEEFYTFIHYNYLNTIEKDGYIYYLLSNNEVISHEDLKEHFNNYNLDIFELGRIVF